MAQFCLPWVMPRCWGWCPASKEHPGFVAAEPWFEKRVWGNSTDTRALPVVLVNKINVPEERTNSSYCRTNLEDRNIIWSQPFVRK